jgi:hypothetical protein
MSAKTAPQPYASDDEVGLRSADKPCANGMSAKPWGAGVKECEIDQPVVSSGLKRVERVRTRLDRPFRPQRLDRLRVQSKPLGQYLSGMLA